tara:strand:- start:627 stop:857 length:231 start_codon:yes stop_codon:yes gene_type:complete
MSENVDFHSLHGVGASPIRFGELLIVPFDGSSAEKQRVGWKNPSDQARRTGDRRGDWKYEMARAPLTFRLLVRFTF